MACRSIGRFAAATIQQQQKGRPSATFVKNKRSFSAALLSPTYEFPELPFQPGTTAISSEPNITTLPSGLKVITENASYSTSITLTFPNGGSRNESLSESGASLANKYTSFKSGSGLSTLVIIRNLENDGAVPYAFADRFSAGVGFVCGREKAERIVPLLATRCSYEKWDLRDVRGMANDVVDEAMTNAQAVLTEHLYSAAYGAQSSLGRPFHTKNASNESIISFRERSYIANGAVLAATGITDHDAFVQVVKDGFSDLSPGGVESSSASSTYIGGECRMETSSHGYAHIAMAFKGIEGNTPLSNVVKHCLALSCPSNAVSPFSSPALIGLYTATPSTEASAATDTLVSILSTPPTKELITKAKTLAKAEALFGMNDSSKNLGMAMTTSVLESGDFSIQGIVDSYDSIDENVVMNAISTMLSTNLSFAAVGEIGMVPYHATISAKFS